MRISDWSSDVCSSDLSAIFQCFDHDWPLRVSRVVLTASGGPFRNADLDIMRHAPPEPAAARKSVVAGKSVSVRVDLGGRRIITQQTMSCTTTTRTTTMMSPFIFEHHSVLPHNR